MKDQSLGILRIIVTSFIMTSLTLLPSAVFSQKKDPRRAARVIRIDTVKVEGRIQKPEAFYILQRSELSFEGLEPKKSFLPLIIKSVDKAPF